MTSTSEDHPNGAIRILLEGTVTEQQLWQSTATALAMLRGWKRNTNYEVKYSVAGAPPHFVMEISWQKSLTETENEIS